MNTTELARTIETVVRDHQAPGAALIALTRTLDDPDAAFGFWWDVTCIGCTSYRIVTHGHADPCGNPVQLTFISLHGDRVDVDDVSPADRLFGRWTAAAMVEDVDTARALWNTVDDIDAGAWFCWRLWLQTLCFVSARLHRQAHQQ